MFWSILTTQPHGRQFHPTNRSLRKPSRADPVTYSEPNRNSVPCQFTCVWHFVFLPQRCWCCPSSPSLPHDAPGRRVGAPASLRPAWRGMPVMPTWSHCWVYNTEINWKRESCKLNSTSPILLQRKPSSFILMLHVGRHPVSYVSEKIRCFVWRTLFLSSLLI